MRKRSSPVYLSSKVIFKINSVYWKVYTRRIHVNVICEHVMDIRNVRLVGVLGLDYAVGENVAEKNPPGNSIKLANRA